MSSVPMIYNIPTGQWVHDFVILGPLPTLTTATVAGPTSTNNSSTPTPTGPASTSSSLTSGGAIGGAIGGVVILAVFGIFFYRRHRLHRHNRTNKPLTSSSIVNSEGEHHRPSSKAARTLHLLRIMTKTVVDVINTGFNFTRQTWQSH